MNSMDSPTNSLIGGARIPGRTIPLRGGTKGFERHRPGQTAKERVRLERGLRDHHPPWCLSLRRPKPCSDASIFSFQSTNDRATTFRECRAR
jgi:hypothetical protein